MPSLFEPFRGPSRVSRVFILRTRRGMQLPVYYVPFPPTRIALELERIFLPLGLGGVAGGTFSAVTVWTRYPFGWASVALIAAPILALGLFAIGVWRPVHRRHGVPRLSILVRKWPT